MNKQPTLLYVEDEARSRKVMQMVITLIDVDSLVVFEDSTDFLVKAEALTPRPDVVFLDIHMKPHTGFEMLAMLRESTKFQGVPVVAMTASVMNEEVNQLRVAGFNGCIAKPIDMDTFPDLLNRILAGEEIWRILS